MTPLDLNTTLVELAYFAAAVSFILGLKLLSVIAESLWAAQAGSAAYSSSASSAVGRGASRCNTTVFGSGVSIDSNHLLKRNH